MRNYLKRMEREGVQRVKMFLVITAAYGIFWGPLFFVTLVDHPIIGNPTGYEVNLSFLLCYLYVCVCMCRFVISVEIKMERAEEKNFLIYVSSFYRRSVIRIRKSLPTGSR